MTDTVLWKRGLGTLAAAFLGLVLLLAAWGKVIDPVLFAEQIAIEGLDFLFSADIVALIAVAIEIALGMALLLGLRRLWVLLPATALTAFFLILTGRQYWYYAQGLVDDSASCGCFGNLVLRTPAEAFWQDLLLLVPALMLAFVGRTEGGFPRKRVAIAVVASVLGTAAAWNAPDLPLDDFATRLRPASPVADLCYGRNENRLCLDLVIPELAQGDHWVVIVDLADPAFGAAVEGLNAFALADEGRRLWALTDATADEQYAFFWQWGPVFEVREAPQPLLRPLYRRLPRSFMVRDGEVIETRSGLPYETDERPITTDESNRRGSDAIIAGPR